MTDWATFVGLTGVVTVLLLALSHTSQSVLEGSDDAADADADPDPPNSAPGDGRVREQPRPGLSSGALLVNVALSQGLFATVLIAAAWYTRIPGGALGIGTTPSVRALGIGLGLGTALYLASEAGGRIADRLDFEYDERLRSLLAPDDLGGWAVLLLVVLPVIAVFEEFLFRAALIGAIASGYGLSPWLLAVGSSALFALGHGAQGWTGIAVTGLLGLVLAGAFVLTWNLFVVVVAHYVVNALEFVVHEGLGVD